jgi:hypothetical protein
MSSPHSAGDGGKVDMAIDRASVSASSCPSPLVCLSLLGCLILSPSRSLCFFSSFSTSISFPDLLYFYPSI